jgi:hypothetical protein
MNDVRSNFGPQFEPVCADNAHAQAEVKSGFDEMHTTLFSYPQHSLFLLTQPPKKCSKLLHLDAK